MDDVGLGGQVPAEPGRHDVRVAMAQDVVRVVRAAATPVCYRIALEEHEHARTYLRAAPGCQEKGTRPFPDEPREDEHHPGAEGEQPGD